MYNYIYAKTKCHYISLIAHFVSQVRSMWSSCGNRNDFKIKVDNICYDHLVNNCNVLQVEVNWIRRGLFPQRLGCPLAHRLLDLQESNSTFIPKFQSLTLVSFKAFFHSKNSHVRGWMPSRFKSQATHPWFDRLSGTILMWALIYADFWVENT